MRCTVRGHEHELVLVRTVTQKGTGDQAALWECPTGRYRFFVLAGRVASNAMRMTRPRYGWKES